MAKEIQAKVLKYEAFVDRLNGDVMKVYEQRDKVLSEIAEYQTLKSTASKLSTSTSKPLKAQVDLGCNFYVEAKIPDTSRLFVKLGFGFFLDLTLAETMSFCDRKISHLHDRVDLLDHKASEIKSYIRLVLEGLREIQNLNP